MDITSTQAIPTVAARERDERGFVIATIVFVLVITALPYFYAYITTPADKQFMGIMLDVPDHAQYFSWMHDLARSYLVPNRLTPEPNRAIFFNLLWWMLGRLGLLLGLGYPWMYQLLRLVATALFLLLAYRVVSWFLRDLLMRRVAFLIIAFTSGLGWVLVLLKYSLTNGALLYPLDVYVAEGNTFLDILGYAHFVAAALYIFIFDLVLRGQARNQLRYAAAAGLFALFLGWQHAYDLVLVYGILGGYILLKYLRDRRIPSYLVQGLIIISVISWWPAIYSVILTRADPIWKEVLAQFANAGVFSPNPLHVMVLFGFTFLLALYTALRNNPLKVANKDDKQLFLLAWFLFNFLLIYIPTDFQIHMLNGWQVPMAILATQGLFYYVAPRALKMARKVSPAWKSLGIDIARRGLAVIFLLAILPTNLYLWGWRFTDLSHHEYPYYLYKDEVSAMSWLAGHASPDQVVLSSLTTGQYIPALAGTHAFLAHWAQTLNYYGKENMVEEFFDDKTSDTRRLQILHEYQVSYVFYGPAEQYLGGYNPGNSSLFKIAFSSPRVKVFEVAGNK